MAASVVSAVADAIATSAVVHVFALHDVIKNACAHDVSVMHLLLGIHVMDSMLFWVSAGGLIAPE